MNELFNIKDYVVVITGGTGVLGRTIAKYLAKNGAKVIILGRKEETGKAIVDEIAKEGYTAEFMKTDVMNEELVQKNCDDIIAKYGRIDTLLNAAGGNMPGAVISPEGNIFDLKVEEFQKVLNLNLTGTVIPTQIFLKPMVKQGKGSIINFSSTVGTLEANSHFVPVEKPPPPRPLKPDFLISSITCCGVIVFKTFSSAR